METIKEAVIDKVRGKCMGRDLTFDDSVYCVKEMTLNGKCLRYRAYEGIIYVAEPVAEKYQSLNIYVPECYYAGGQINEFGLKTAPIFFPNTIGGYMPGVPMGPEVKNENEANLMAKALFRGYVVICAGARGRGLKDDKGRNVGIAPAHIVDLKAAVRYIKWNKDRIPGDTEKIISNGTSAGGALSALLGSTGNHPDFEEYLQQIGTAPETDDIFASSCYCPITNLEHADMAYEWEFCGINEGSWWHGDFVLTEKQIEMSKSLAKAFLEYLWSLQLMAASEPVRTEEELKRFILNYVKKSVQRALGNGENLIGYDWLHMELWIEILLWLYRQCLQSCWRWNILK